MAEEAGLVVFDSTNMALKAERLLKNERIQCSVIPTPLEITVECGIALLLRGEWANKAATVLDASDGVVYKLLYPYERDRGTG